MLHDLFTACSCWDKNVILPDHYTKLDHVGICLFTRGKSIHHQLCISRSVFGLFNQILFSQDLKDKRFRYFIWMTHGLTEQTVHSGLVKVQIWCSFLSRKKQCQKRNYLKKQALSDWTLVCYRLQVGLALGKFHLILFIRTINLWIPAVWTNESPYSPSGMKLRNYDLFGKRPEVLLSQSDCTLTWREDPCACTTQ